MTGENWFDTALGHHQAGRLAAAVEAYRAALADDPADYRAHGNLGIALKQLGHLAEAVTTCRKAVALHADYANGWNNLGIALMAVGQRSEAISAYRTALRLDASFHECWSNLGIALTADGLIAEAVTCFDKCLALAPDYTEALTQFVHQSQQMAQWEALDAPLGRLVAQLKAGSGAINPFSLLSVCRDPADLLLCARNYSARIAAASPNLEFSFDRPAHDRLRIGYLSGDFHQHATAYLAAQLFESHDRDRFEIFAYSYGPDDGTPTRRRVVQAFEHFAEVADEPFSETARRIHADEIDILVDLKGYTHGARVQIPAMRPAPILVDYLGYPGSMGADFIDYIIADRFVIPPGTEQHFSEKCVFMPGTYQVNDAAREIAADANTRADHGLPEDGFVFCCFNQTVKITPDVYAVWMQLLQQVPGSVLWLLAFNASAADNLRREAATFGIDPKRLIFAPKISVAEHLARYRHADLFLDTFPCNAHTTASDALWGGCPVVTLSGDTFASRVAGSLLSALGLDELITTSIGDYAATALRLARDPAQLDAIRSDLKATRETSQVFDGEQFARRLEQAYESMWQRHLSGNPPADFEPTPTAVGRG